MSRIKLLPPEIIHRIAAGEVVDRPVSVLKELVENAIDAGAQRLKILIRDGGLQDIEVEDDGVGMTRQDLEVCLQRHATSKIKNIEDLDCVESLGFRGEALAAISSVSKLKIETYSQEVAESWQLESQGSEGIQIKPGTQKRGTKITISELFYNTPARKKFLRSAGMEALACSQMLQDLALSHPKLHWEYFILDSKGEIKEQRKLPPQEASTRFKVLLGLEAELIEVFENKPCPELRSIQIYAAKAPVAFKNQKQIYLFVNGRFVQDKRLAYSLREAYSGLLEVGFFPAVCVFLEADPHCLDINIHPQKKEIRWPQGFSLASVVFRVLRPKLSVGYEIKSTFDNTPALIVEEPRVKPSLFEAPSFPRHENISERLLEAAWVAPLQKPSSSPATSPILANLVNHQVPNFSSLRVVGEVGASWLVLESADGIILVDQHAAHERVQFEKILKTKKLLRSKALLISHKIEIPYWLEDKRSLLEECLEEFSFEVMRPAPNPSQIEIVAVPEADRNILWGELLNELFDSLKDDKNIKGLRAQLEVKLAASLSCHGSVRRGQRLSHEEIKKLMEDLDAVDWKGLCPHGRPVWQLWTHQTLEESFHR